MKLSYRGVKYEAEPSALEVREGGIGGTYRGQEWRFHYPRHIPQTPVHNLKYRGVSYRTSEVGTKPVLVSPTSTAKKLPKWLTNKQPQSIQNQTQMTHLRHIQSNLERRLEAAKAKGDKHLVDLLESEQMELKH
ncbi:MAG: DUF4278 domain-containing protein [Coleofasciculaceae cyanobacterium]